MAEFFLVHNRTAFGESSVNIDERAQRLTDLLKPEVVAADDCRIKRNDHALLIVTAVHTGLILEGWNICVGNWQQLPAGWTENKMIPPSASFCLFADPDRYVLVPNSVAGRSVWYYFDNSCFIVSSSQKAITAWLGSFELNDQAVSWMLSTGNLGPGNAWDRRVKSVHPSERVLCDLNSWNVKVEDVPQDIVDHSRNSTSSGLEELLHSVFSGAAISNNLNQHLLTLSGGYDSRTVLINFLSQGTRLKTATWGLKKAVDEPYSDAHVARQLADHLKLEHQVFYTDFKGDSFESLLNRFLNFGEGRLDHINSFMDGFDMWEQLYQQNVRTVIRADEVFGWLPCKTEQDVRISLDLHKMQDNVNMLPLSEFDLPHQEYPDHYTRGENESLDTWRDRLYRSFRLPYVLTALHDLVHPYMEVVNPLLHRDIIQYCTGLSDQQRTSKKFYVQYASQLENEVPFARKASIPEPAAILRSSNIVPLLKEELTSVYTQGILGTKFSKWVNRHLVVNDQLVNATNRNFAVLLKIYTPWQLKKLLRRDLIGYRGDFNQLAFRAIIVSRMVRLMSETKQLFLNRPSSSEKSSDVRQPLFSVIIPTYNRAAFIKETIQSVGSQLCRDFEVIVIDDGSTDHTEQVVKALNYEGLRYVKLENRERGAARNSGVALAKGKYVCFLDSDDILLPNHFQRAKEIAEVFPDIPVFHLNYEIRPAEDGKQGRVNDLPEVINDLLIQANVISCNGIFIRKDIADSYKFSEIRALSGTEDYELWLRIASEFPIRHFPVVTSVIIDHSGRSMAETDIPKMLKRINLFAELVKSNKSVSSFVGNRMNEFEAYCFSYISLSMALAGNNLQALRYTFKALKFHVPSVFERRSLAIVKHIVLNVLNRRVR